MDVEDEGAIMVEMMLDGKKYFIKWMFCECNSYPMALVFGTGRCGKCGVVVQGSYDTREASEAARLEFYKENT